MRSLSPLTAITDNVSRPFTVPSNTAGANTRLWRLALAQPDTVERDSTSPARFLVRVVLDDEVLEITVDGSGRALETERRSVDTDLSDRDR